MNQFVYRFSKNDSKVDDLFEKSNILVQIGGVYPPGSETIRDNAAHHPTFGKPSSNQHHLIWQMPFEERKSIF